MTVMVCALCGQSLDPSADDVSAFEALSWMRATERGRELAYCPSCSRENLRAIESKLEVEYW